MARSVSMKDVAQLARVSVGTVSNVLNRPSRVSSATRQRVEDAIDKLGWVRNESARQLRAGRSDAVGMIVLDISNPFFADVIRGAEAFCHEQGYLVHIGNSDQVQDRQDDLLRHFEQHRVRGVLLAPISSDLGLCDQLKRRGIPVVLVDRTTSGGFCAVGVDDVEGGRLAVGHLLEQGHRRLAFVGGPGSLAQVRDRRLGGDLALARVADAAAMLVVSTPTLDVASGLAAAGEIAALPDGERPTGVFACNDLVAIGLLQGFVAAGLAIPGDVAIIGYDDIDFAAASAVPLSSVRQPRFELGATAARLLFDEIAAADEQAAHSHSMIRLAPELVGRQSTAAGRAG
ncbi:MAG: LacI family transcriptional regulator [Propionibacteriaceae bacterium]|jgi:LacI family transcriptional regulator|nr:LacI family transcriptional regulator [Propionibacteriaceae bacterium]